MTRRRLIQAHAAIEEAQFQPASLDLRLGKEVYRVRASFLPGRDRTVLEHLESLNPERISLTGPWRGAGKGIVYIAPLIERLDLLPSLSGAANPKSSTGRLDIFTRLIVDGSEAFDDVPIGYRGPLYVGDFAAQLQRARARRLAAQPDPLPQPKFATAGLIDFALKDHEIRQRHEETPLVDGVLDVREGLIMRVSLRGTSGQIVGYRAQKNGDIIDVDRPGFYAAEEFWEPIRRARRRAAQFSTRMSSTSSRRAKKCKSPLTWPPKWRRSTRPSANFASTTPDSSIRASAMGRAGAQRAGGAGSAQPRRCRSCWKTASRSGASSMKSSATRPTSSMARPRCRIIRARAEAFQALPRFLARGEDAPPARGAGHALALLPASSGPMVRAYRGPRLAATRCDALWQPGIKVWSIRLPRRVVAGADRRP